uniref:AGC-kinase C-terminal domain-containing protein n=1 Tax=Heligmosomoides polygyrus TaxID=6339 RepID=A0A183GP14_HELPZ
LSITKTSIKSSEFITDEKASDIMQREQERFLRGYGYIIPDDPRFNRSHFEKENSWEPSVINQLSFDASTPQYGADSLPLPESVAVSVPNRCDQLEANGADRRAVAVNNDKVHFGPSLVSW